MKRYWQILAVVAVASHAQTPAPGDPVIQIDFANPNLSPSAWTLTLHTDGSGHFRSQMGTPPATESSKIDTPAVDRDIHVSPSYAAQVFTEAQRQKDFNVSCESRLKVAFQGWKTLTYTGPEGHGSCTFNYSKDSGIQKLSDSLESVALTILEGARLESLSQHDRLGLDPEMEYLSDAVSQGRAQQIAVIRDTLELLANDDQILARVRKRARVLLARADQ